MKVLILLALGLAAVVADPLRYGERVLGGSEIDIRYHPYASALLVYYSNNYVHGCTGTIINNRSLISSAHCFINNEPYFNMPDSWLMRVGSSYTNSGGSVYAVQSIVGHPNYNRQTFDSDIVVIRSTLNFVLSTTVRAVPIAGTNYNVADNAIVHCVGWAPSYISHLRYVYTRTVSEETCRTRYAELGRSITENMMCSGWLDIVNRDQCQGDSGSSVIHNNVLVGVYTWSFQCSYGRHPSISTKVSSFATWIENNA